MALDQYLNRVVSINDRKKETGVSAMFKDPKYNDIVQTHEIYHPTIEIVSQTWHDFGALDDWFNKYLNERGLNKFEEFDASIIEQLKDDCTIILNNKQDKDVADNYMPDMTKEKYCDDDQYKELYDDNYYENVEKTLKAANEELTLANKYDKDPIVWYDFKYESIY